MQLAKGALKLQENNTTTPKLKTENKKPEHTTIKSAHAREAHSEQKRSAQTCQPSHAYAKQTPREHHPMVRHPSCSRETDPGTRLTPQPLPKNRPRRTCCLLKPRSPPSNSPGKLDRQAKKQGHLVHKVMAGSVGR